MNYTYEMRIHRIPAGGTYVRSTYIYYIVIIINVTIDRLWWRIFSISFHPINNNEINWFVCKHVNMVGVCVFARSLARMYSSRRMCM